MEIKRVSCMTSWLLLTLLTFGKSASAAPSKVELLCKVGLDPEFSVLLRNCTSSIDAHGYGQYRCKGEITKDWSVAFLGFGGMSSGVIRITYLPMQVTGGSPIQMGETTIGCRQPHAE